ncbi:MAG: fumarylacetoacetase [Phycisphaerales bacterium]
MNETHDAALRSWVESANDPSGDFPIQNLPLCAFMVEHDDHEHPHMGVRIGESVLDVAMLAEAGWFDLEQDDEGIIPALLHQENWTMVGAVPELMSIVRGRIQDFLRHDAPAGGQQGRRLRQKAILPVADLELLHPTNMSNYTDFYASIHHATTVGSMFRPESPLLPNYKHVPIGYHGRASSIVLSGTSVRRPMGQQSPPDDKPGEPPTFGPCTMLDYELEVGVVVGRGNEMGEPIAIGEAGKRMLGLCLVNDWSARDIQKWEYQPLGPFLAKNFATTVSPYLVTAEALAPFRCAAMARPAGDPAPLPYLIDAADQAEGGFAITLEVWLQSAEMRKRGISPVLISRTGAFREMYWTLGQLITHHASNGCNLLPGDLLASGTVSGQAANERGCLLELTWQGRGPDGKPLPRKGIELPSGEKRLFLQDGDEVVMRGYCEREGFARIGFGECRGTIEPAKA